MEKVKSLSRLKTGVLNGNGSANGKAEQDRLPVLKTFKQYIDGKFVRSESGRYYKLTTPSGELIAGICKGSKKDFRDAVVSSVKAQEQWSKKTAYNKGQILYRIAETLEGRSEQFISSLVRQGVSQKNASAEVSSAIDRLVYYAGWSDKYQQVFSTVNPVESSHFNFSFPEPTGIVSVISNPDFGLLGLVSAMAPLIVGGNSAIILADDKFPLTAVEFAEVLHASDLPGGVVNLITGFKKELTGVFSNHMQVSAVSYWGSNTEELKTIQTNAALNIKRVHNYPITDITSADAASPYFIMDFQEIKTTWHPVGI